MSRTRAYTRRMRSKHIRRKKRIVANWRWSDDHPLYAYDGMYSKNKVHCSCRMCRSSDYNGRHIPTIQERRNDIGGKYIAPYCGLDA